MKRRINWWHVLEAIATLISLVVIMWVAFSIVDVNLHNTIGDNYQQFHEWNIFTHLF